MEINGKKCRKDYWKKYRQLNKKHIKECHRKYRLKNREKIRENYKEYCKNRLKKNPNWNRERYQRKKIKMKEYYKKHKDYYNEKAKEYRNQYPQKTKARNLANRKIKTKNECESCGIKNIKIQKHHEDYSFPLEVNHLCIGCHSKLKTKFL